MKIISKAPTRIDLAGGTVDIWPLYLFLKSPRTVNMGINLFAETTLESKKSQKEILLKASDQNVELKLKWSDLDSIDLSKVHPAVSLHVRYLKYFAHLFPKKPSHGLTLSTRAQSPAGAGLGGSSTLSVSMVGALQQWCGLNGIGSSKLNVEKVGESLIEITRDIETTVIEVPAGLQDYYGAMFGGVQSLQWGIAKHEHHHLDESLVNDLSNRVSLFYSGQSRNSGINNWSLYKSFIDKDKKVRDLFTGISESTLECEKALTEKDWKGVGKAIASEWKFRKKLAAGITTPTIDKAFEIAQKEGATAGKICGAGGGGCFFVYHPENNPDRTKKMIEKIASLSGVRSLPFEGSKKGLQVKVLEND